MKKHWKSGFILCLAILLGLSLSHPTPTHASVIMQDNTQTDVKVDAQSSKTITSTENQSALVTAQQVKDQ